MIFGIKKIKGALEPYTQEKYQGEGKELQDKLIQKQLHNKDNKERNFNKILQEREQETNKLLQSLYS